MPRANEIKKGMVLNYNGKLLLVKDIDIQSPTARGAATLYKMRFSDVRTGLKVEERFKGDDIVDTVTLTRRYVDFSYVDGNEYVFMDKEDYTPYTFTKDQIEEELLFMPEGGMPDMQVLTWDGQLLALELPQTVDLEIVETAPGIKGASASARAPSTEAAPGTSDTLFGSLIDGAGATCTSLAVKKRHSRAATATTSTMARMKRVL